MKDYDKDLIWSQHPEFPEQLDLKIGNKKLASIYRILPYHYDWKIATSDETTYQFTHLFKDHDGFGKPDNQVITYGSRFKAMRVVMHRINKYIKQFNSEGIDTKMYYVNVHSNEHLIYTTQEFFTYS